MKYTIGKWFAFEAAHQLDYLPSDHKCSRLHGHSYRVQLVLSSQTLDESDFVTDYGDMRIFQGWIDSLDHKNLNDIFMFKTTAENLAKFLFEQAEKAYPSLIVECVEVRETEKTFARYGR